MKKKEVAESEACATRLQCNRHLSCGSHRVLVDGCRCSADRCPHVATRCVVSGRYMLMNVHSTRWVVATEHP